MSILDSLNNWQFRTLAADHLYFSVEELADLPYNEQEAAGLEVRQGRVDPVDEATEGCVMRFRHRSCAVDDGRVGGVERFMTASRCVVDISYVRGHMSIRLLGRCLAKRRCRITADSSIRQNDHGVTVKVTGCQSHEIDIGVARRIVDI